MSMDELLEKLLDSYEIYYNIKREDVEPPFDAEAHFFAKNEQYFLMQSAKLSEMQASEFVYFIKRADLDGDELEGLSKTAWERGMARVEPNPDHKSSDVILIVITEKISDGIRKKIRSCRFSKSYKLGLWGFSNYKLAVIEASTGDAVYNGQGRALKSTMQRIFAPDKKSFV